MNAARFGCHENVRILLEAGADSKKKSKNGHDAAMIAKQSGYEELGNFIETYGVDKNHKSSFHIDISNNRFILHSKPRNILVLPILTPIIEDISSFCIIS